MRLHLNVIAALLAVGMLLPASAQESAAAPEGAPGDAAVQVSDSYLDPLKAVEEDESAFVDQLWSMGNPEFERIGELEEIISRGRSNPAPAAAAARELRERLPKLEALAEYGMQRYSNNARVRNFNGRILYDYQGDQMGGVKEWHTAISLDSSYSNPHSNLGMHYFHSGRYSLGFEYMDKALELEPDNPDYCFNMAQNYLIFRPQTEKHRGWSPKKIYKEAMKLSERAAKNAPDDFEILQDYAVNFQAAENFGVKAKWKKAARAWQEAREHARSDNERFYTWLNEGRAWRALGNKNEAIRCFEEGLKIRPESKVAQRNIDRLRKDD